MRHARRNDRWQPQAGQEPPFLSPLLGTWFNCDADTGEILRLELLERDGGLWLRAYGADETTPIDWGEATAIPHVQSLGSREVTGFTACYDFGFMETRIAANIKYGVLVIQSYNRFLDGSGRPCYFTREFFHQVLEPQPQAPRSEWAGLPSRMAGDRPLAGVLTVPRGVDLGPLLGRWRNTYRNSKGIASVALTRAGDGYSVEGRGVGCAKIGVRCRHPHASGVSSRQPAGFLARYDFGFSELFLSANEAKGLLIIASFSTFRDGSGRSNYFTREFFYRESPADAPVP